MTLTETRKLRDLSGVGKSIEADLLALGVKSVPDLATREGDALYDQRHGNFL
jgi:hypothetical protein